jgi:hypothetical protein
MMPRLLQPLVAATLVASGAACHSERQGDERARAPSVEVQARRGELTFADSQTVIALRAPKAPGRILYDHPEDLSITNAMRMRPDLVKPDSSRRDTSLTKTRRDSTGGDATADTSGGAAKPKRP